MNLLLEKLLARLRPAIRRKISVGDSILYEDKKGEHEATIIELHEYYPKLYEAIGILTQSKSLREVNSDDNFWAKLDNLEIIDGSNILKVI